MVAALRRQDGAGDEAAAQAGFERAQHDFGLGGAPQDDDRLLALSRSPARRDCIYLR